MAYKNDPNLRGAGEVYEYTPEEIQEIVKCQSDIIYFAEKYFKIVTVEHGEIFISMHDFQKKIIKAMMNTPDGKRHICLLSGRQVGKCLSHKSLINIRNIKNTKGKTLTISIGRFYLQRKISKIIKKMLALFKVTL